jgi:aminoglycoside phosphotransferase (APT) family kinase protein
MASYARLLADLHNLVHGVPGPPWLDQPFGPGDRLLHLDLHPENVLIGRSGPVIIDWSNAAVGPRDADVADAFLIISSANAPGGVFMRTLAPLGQRYLAGLFLRAAGANISSVVAAAANRRLADKNLNSVERQRISQLAQRHQRR